jgi:hypothetical protein
MDGRGKMEVKHIHYLVLEGNIYMVKINISYTKIVPENK